MNYTAAVEAILFAGGEPLEMEKIAAGLGLDLAAARQQIVAYGESLKREDRGLRLLFLEDKVQLCTKSEYKDPVASVIAAKKNAPLSPAAMEVLAIVAYNQPVTRSLIEQVRGVDSSQVVNTLCEKGLLEEKGRLSIPGRPIAYGTTAHFLRTFGLSSLSELPPLPDADSQLILEETMPFKEDEEGDA